MDTREQILAAAKHVIRTRGLAHTTTKAIAQEANCAEGTLFHYFPTKDALLVALINERIPGLVAAFQDQVTVTRSVEDNLKELVRLALRFSQEFIPFAAALFAMPQVLEQHRKALQADNKHLQRGYEFVGNYVRTEQQRGRIADNVDPVAVAALLMGASFQFVFFHEFMGENISADLEERFIHSLVQTLHEGLRPTE